MWRLIRSEFDYNRKLFLGLVAVIPLLSLLVVYPIEDFSPNLLAFTMTLLMLQNWAVFRNKEKRVCQQIRLPLSLRRIALTRILLVMIASSGYLVLYAFICFGLMTSGRVNYVALSMIFGIILLVFSVYFILRDLLLDFFRKLGLTKERMIVALLLVVVGLNILGVYVMIQTNTSGTAPLPVRATFDFLRRNNPFGGEYGAVKFLALSALLASLTVISFERRKSYLE
jgi:hypothetical protein